ncbi:unnamed protein product [Caenorhabditis brenneri]
MVLINSFFQYHRRRASEKMFVIQELRADGDTFTSKESIVIRRVDENNEPKLVVYLKSSNPLGTPTQSMDVSLDINLYTRAYHRPSAHLNKDNQLEEQHGTQICTWI